MKSSEEMTRSVMDKIRTAQAERARRNKMIAGIAAVVTPLVIVTAVFGAVNLRSGSMKKAADSAQVNEVIPENADYYAGEENIAEDFYDREAYKSSGKSAKSAGADEADGAVTLTYEELCTILPDGNLLKGLEEKGFTVSDCPAKLKDGAQGRNYSDFVYLSSNISKDEIGGVIICRPGYTRPVKEFISSETLRYLNPKVLDTNGTSVIYSINNTTCNAVFFFDGTMYEFNVSGVNTNEEISTLINDFLKT
jgi:hypothetical protein